MSYITVMRGLRGWQAVYLWWDKDYSEYVPHQVGIGVYLTKAEAISEARDWSEAEYHELRVKEE